MLYGSACPSEFQPLLHPALTWKVRVLLVREVGENQSVSYGRTFITPQRMRIATLAIGYADGFPRQASGRNAHVLVGGRRCAVLGRVTMDQILVDVTALSRVAAGDEAIVIGKQGSEEILAKELADQAGTISWDIFTGIGNRTRRFYF
jgi:alanine racemase